MTFQIHALPQAPFAELFTLDDEALRQRNAVRVTADAATGFPCRVSLQEAEEGDTLVLCNFRHLDAPSPYAASHAVYVLQNAVQARLAPGAVPDVLSRRFLSVRGFDAARMMIAGDVVPGAELAQRLERMLADPLVELVQIHSAQRGCYLAAAAREEAVWDAV
ncbi:DUF1203 domain-containing protein [Thalassococcus sp. BH17M4-6]|uniref:DUF1203 domain-containing protein n=1 Tax=Thalassococcus sp. BH17M4-6 TaxID=3413148 RepID=UPI003BCF8123